jgi:Flp pilus assembly protein TadB
MTRRKAEAAGAVIAGLVAVHEHDRTLRQERRLPGKPSPGDQVPSGLLLLIFAGLFAYGPALFVGEVWPWLLTIAALAAAGLLLRRGTDRRRRRPRLRLPPSPAPSTSPAATPWPTL